jgi:hypothetical protein
VDVKTHRCIRLVCDTWMHQACVGHIDASGTAGLLTSTSEMASESAASSTSSSNELAVLPASPI